MKIPILLAATLVTASSVRALPPAVSSDYELIWQDEFDGTNLDRSYWDYVTGERRDAVNTEDAVSVTGGSAVITTYTSGTAHYTGFIQTKEKFSQPYGYYEARIKFNDASGMWSAFWLMPYTIGTPLGQPDIGGVEIDIVEHRMKKQNGTSIENVINSGLHWDGYNANHKKTNNESVQPTLLNGTWHTYGVLWTPAGYTFYFDDTPIWQTSSAVSHRSSFVLLSSEVEGAGWAGQIPAGGYGSPAASTTKMTTDYVRVYALNPSVSGQSAFTPHQIPLVPGTLIEAEHFDNGGQHVAYYEKAGSGVNGTEYGEYLSLRPDTTVDLKLSANASGNIHVSHGEKPEWLEYTIDATQTGFYSAHLVVATSSAANGKMQLFADGVSLGSVQVQNTGGDDSWKTLSTAGLLEISAPRTFVARAEFFTETPKVNFDAIKFVYLGNAVHLKEAEDAVLSGGPSVTDTPHASAGKTVAGLTASGALVRWTGMDGFNGGAATLTFRYYSLNATCVRNLYVNGTLVGPVSFPSTRLNAMENVTIQAGLNPGKTNTVELRSTGSDNKSPNLDYLVTSKTVSDEPVTLEAEAATLAGGTYAAAQNNASGGEVVLGIESENSSIVWNGVSGNGSPATLSIRYLRGSSTATKKSLFVNGALVEQLSFPTLSNWYTFGTVTRQVSLPAGSLNTIMIKNNGTADDNMPLRIDCVTVTP